MQTTNERGEHFAEWLRLQQDRGDMIDALAAGVRADRALPKSADPEAVRKRLREQQADGDLFAAVDDAESDWLSY